MSSLKFSFSYQLLLSITKFATWAIADAFICHFKKRTPEGAMTRSQNVGGDEMEGTVTAPIPGPATITHLTI